MSHLEELSSTTASRHDGEHSHRHHNHLHHHHHHHLGVGGDGLDQSLNKAFIIGIGLNAAYVVIEAVFGFVYSSMGLLSDAGHNLSDVAALVLSMVAFRMAARKPDSAHTYGYKRFTIEASVLNSLLLCAAVGAILVEAIDKLIHPTAVDGPAIAWVAGAGVVVNGLTAWLFMKGRKNDLNIRAAFLHMAADMLVSVGVVIAGIIIYFTGWYFIDPTIGIVIALIVGRETWLLLRQSMRMSIDSVPESVDMNRLVSELRKVEGVESIHHIHVWPLSTTETAMTVHAVVADPTVIDRITADMRRAAAANGIRHSTIETETAASGHAPALICDE